MKYFQRLICLGMVLCTIFSGLLALDESRVKEFTLDNGLKVITYELHTAPVIYSHLTYNVGSKYEPFNQTGISHIVEHMMFKGTSRFPKGTISELISANCGIYNAYTSTDLTVYYELLPKNKIDLAFDIESERMYKCAFDPVEFKSELNVIMEERKQRTENSADGETGKINNAGISLQINRQIERRVVEAYPRKAVIDAMARCRWNQNLGNQKFAPAL